MPKLNSWLSFLFINLFFIASLGTTFGQNLVPNPSFENLKSYPCKWMGSYTQFNSAIYDWTNPTLATSDIRSALTSTTCWANPLYTSFIGSSSYDGWQTPRTGNSYLGIIPFEYGYSWREYAQVRLNSPMEVGKKYQVTFFASLADNSDYAIANLGAYFSVSMIEGSYLTSSNLNVQPQVESKKLVLETDSWVKIDATITAEAAYQYLTIGNFRSNSETNYISVTPKIPFVGLGYAYYFIDDVSVILSCLQVSDDKVICLGNSVELTATGDNFTGWANQSSPNTLISTATKITVSPTVSSTFLAYSLCDTNEVSVTIASNSLLDLGKDTVICKGKSILFNSKINQPGTTYFWQDGSVSPFLTATAAGTYKVKVLIGGCFNAEDSIKLSYKSTPDIDFGPDTTLCYGQTLTLNAYFPGATYYWPYWGNISPVQEVNYSGNQSVTITSKEGCTQQESIYVSFNGDKPIFDLGADQILCPYEKSIIKVELRNYYSTQFNTKYKWQDGSNKSVYSVTTGGKYWVDVNYNGCTAKDSINISFKKDESINLGNDTSLCEGQQLLLKVNNNSKNFWQGNYLGNQYLVTTTGIYHVNTRIDDCNYEDYIYVQIYKYPKLNLGGEMGLEEGKTIQLDAYNDNSTYLWQDGSDKDKFTVHTAGLYFVAVGTNNLCFSYDTVNVMNIRFKMPNVFTPNDDGKNELFVPMEMEGITNAQLIIQNRWGETIFKDTNLNLQQGWNGKIGQTLVPDGVYFWVVNCTDINGKAYIVKGDVQIIR